MWPTAAVVVKDLLCDRNSDQPTSEWDQLSYLLPRRSTELAIVLQIANC